METMDEQEDINDGLEKVESSNSHLPLGESLEASDATAKEEPGKEPSTAPAESANDEPNRAEGVEERTDATTENDSKEGNSFPSTEGILGAKKGDDEVTLTFPQRLMDILDDEKHAEIITWLPHGRGFMIHKKKLFETDVMPNYFQKHSKYTSFTRKLNRWGFVRVTRGPEMGAYYHKYFKKGETRLCMQMSCQRPSGMSEFPQGGGVPPGYPMPMQQHMGGYPMMANQPYLPVQQQHFQMLMRHRDQMMQREAMMRQQQGGGPPPPHGGNGGPPMNHPQMMHGGKNANGNAGGGGGYPHPPPPYMMPGAAQPGCAAQPENNNGMMMPHPAQSQASHVGGGGTFPSTPN